MDLFDIVRSAPPPKSVRDRPSASNRDSSKRSLSPSSVSTFLDISDSEHEVEHNQRKGEAMRKKRAAKSKSTKFTCGSISDDSDDEVIPKSQVVNTESESNNDSDSASEDEHTQPQPLKTKAQQKMFADGPVPSKGQKQQQLGNLRTKRCAVRIKRLLQAEINRLQTSISQKKPNKRGRPRRSAESPSKKPKPSPTDSSSSSSSKAFIKVSGLQNGSPQQLESNNRPLHRFTPPPNLCRKKRELTQQQMEARYGRRFFNLVVKIKRMRENIYMPKRSHNKSVSFNESIEIFGSKSRKSSYISVSNASLCSMTTNASSAISVSSSGRSTTSATTSGSSRSTNSAAHKSSPAKQVAYAPTSAAAIWGGASTSAAALWGSHNSKPSSMKSSTPKPSASKSGTSKHAESVPTRLQRVDATGNVLEDIDLGPNIPLDTSRNKSSNRKRSSASSCNGGGRAKKSSRTHLPSTSTIPVTADDDDEYIVPNEYNGASGSVQTQSQTQNIRHHKSGHHGASGSSKRSANSSGGRSKIQRRPSLYVPVTGLASLSIEDRQEDAESQTTTTTTTTGGDDDNSTGKSQAKKPTTSTNEKPKATAQTTTDPMPAKPVEAKKKEPEKPYAAEYAALLMPAPELPHADRSKPVAMLEPPAVRIGSREVSPFSLAIMDDVASADDILEIQTSIQDVRDLYTPPSRQGTSALLRPPINRSTGLESPDSDYSFKSANEPDGNSTVLNDDDDDDRTQSPNSQRLHISTPSTPRNDSTPSPTSSLQANTLNGGNEATTDSTANPSTNTINTSPTNTTNTVNMPPGLPSGDDIPNLDDVELGFWNPTSTPTLSTLPTNQINRHAISDTWRM